jgi:DNA-binding transcriptional regulator YhcF (GntR family)
MEKLDSGENSAPAGQDGGLSYKFERLREKLRLAISSGELNGKLPGERALAKRFHVNAKTLSKALTDLAAEGVLERSIGRGTFVKGSAPELAAGKRWLVLCDAEQAAWEIVQLLRNYQSDTEVLTDIRAVRPSFLNQVSAVIDLAPSTPDSFIRDLVVRNIPVVVVGKEPKTYSTHSVIFDGQLGVAMLGRDLLLSGHRRLAAVEPRHCTVVAHSLRQAAARYAPGATVDACFPEDIPAMVQGGITAFVCQNVELAVQAKQQLERLAVEVPGRVSLAAVGSASQEKPVSGYFMSRSEKAQAIIRLLCEQPSRPTAIWLAGVFEDRGTIAPFTAADACGEGSSVLTPDNRTDAAA